MSSVQSKIPTITFTVEDMLLKDNKHDRPLNYTGYIGSTGIERILVDPGPHSALFPKGSSTSLGYNFIGYL